MIHMTYKKRLPKYKELAADLGVSESAVKQYNKRKRELMLKGMLYEKLQDEYKQEEIK